MDNVELIELLEEELDIIILKAHNLGLNYWQIMKVVLDRYCQLVVQSQSEFIVKGGR